MIKVVGARAEEVLGERARDLHVPPDDWTEDLLGRHDDFVSELDAMRERVAQIVEKVHKREDLVKASRKREGGTRGSGAGAELGMGRCGRGFSANPGAISFLLACFGRGVVSWPALI